MGYARNFVVGDLLAINQHLAIWCNNPDCWHQERWSAVRAVETFGASSEFASLAGRLRCSKCGRRGLGAVTVRACDLDATAWSYREKIARHPGSFDFEGSMVRLMAAAGGELGGDGPVQWPPERPSMGG